MNDDHGNPANITLKKLQTAAKAGKVISAHKAATNIVDTLRGKIKTRKD